MNPIINKYITVFVMLVCCSASWSQNEFDVESLIENDAVKYISFYQNDADDEFNLGLNFTDRKNTTVDLKLLYDADFANDFETYSFRDFFVLDFNLIKSIGRFDILLSIENAFNFGDTEVTNEPVLAQNNGLTYLSEFEHEAGFVAMLGICYNF